MKRKATTFTASTHNPMLDDIQAVLRQIRQWQAYCICAGKLDRFCESFGCGTLEEIAAMLKKWEAGDDQA